MQKKDNQRLMESQVRTCVQCKKEFTVAHLQNNICEECTVINNSLKEGEMEGVILNYDETTRTGKIILEHNIDKIHSFTFNKWIDKMNKPSAGLKVIVMPNGKIYSPIIKTAQDNYKIDSKDIFNVLDDIFKVSVMAGIVFIVYLVFSYFKDSTDTTDSTHRNTDISCPEKVTMAEKYSLMVSDNIRANKYNEACVDLSITQAAMYESKDCKDWGDKLIVSYELWNRLHCDTRVKY